MLPSPYFRCARIWSYRLQTIRCLSGKVWSSVRHLKHHVGFPIIRDLFSKIHFANFFPDNFADKIKFGICISIAFLRRYLMVSIRGLKLKSMEGPQKWSLCGKDGLAVVVKYYTPGVSSTRPARCICAAREHLKNWQYYKF